MDVSFDGKSMLASELQFAKAKSPRVCRFEGSLTVCSAVHPMKPP